MSYGYTYTFPALRGIQARREYYVAMCPLKLLPKIFLFDEGSLPPDWLPEEKESMSHSRKKGSYREEEWI